MAKIDPQDIHAFYQGLVRSLTGAVTSHGNGILASTHPVTLDQACVDIVSQANGSNSLMNGISNRVNGIRQAYGTIRALSPRQVADLLGHGTSQIAEMYDVKKETGRLAGVTDGFEL